MQSEPCYTAGVSATPLTLLSPGTMRACTASASRSAAADPDVGTVAIGLNLPHAATPDGLAVLRRAGRRRASRPSTRHSSRRILIRLRRPGRRAARGGRRQPRALVAGCSARPSRDRACCDAATASPTAADATGRPTTYYWSSPAGPPSDWDEVSVRGALATYGVPVVREERAPIRRAGWPLPTVSAIPSL